MRKILLADDSNVAQRMGKEILSAEGFEVLTVSNGQAAVKMLKEFAPDLILADVFMPGRNGYELCQYVKSEAKSSHIPVVLLVGAMEPYDPEEGRKAKANGVITKPLQSSNLVRVVKDLLASAKPPAQPPPPAVAVQEAAPVEAEEPSAQETSEESVSLEATVEIAPEAAGEPSALFADLLEPAGETEAPPETSEEVAVTETMMEATPPPPTETGTVFPTFSEVSAVSEENAIQEPTPVAANLPGTEFLADFIQAAEIETDELPQPPIAEPPPPEAPTTEKIVWTAEPAEVTAEDEKLFHQTSSEWEGLTKLVEAEDTENSGGRLSWGPSEPAPAAAILPEEEFAQEPAPPPTPQSGHQAEKIEAKPAAVDPATIERLVRQAVDEMMPQIVDRVVRTVGIILRREE